jgi:hypothetical protein
MDLYSSASTQRPEELSGGATLPPPNTAIAEQQVLEQTIAERVVPKLQAPTTSAPGPQTKVLGHAGDPRVIELSEQPQEALEPEGQHQPALENQEQPQLASEQQFSKPAEVVGTIKEPTGSARPGKNSSLQPQPWKKSSGIMKKKAGLVVPAPILWTSQ